MSMDAKMAWRNVWRNKRRTILTVLAIAFACVLLVFMLSWQFGSYQVMINSAVMIHTGHLQIQAKGYNQDRKMRMVVPKPDIVSRLLKNTPDIKAQTQRANAFSLLSSKNRTYGALVVGIDPQKEPQVSRLKKLIRKGSFLDPKDKEQAIIGWLLARNLQIGLNDEVTILGQGRDGSIAATVVKIKGIYRSGQDEFDRSSIQIPLKTFQDVYAMRGAVHEVVALADSLSDVNPVMEQIKITLPKLKEKRKLAALDWDELMPGLLQSIEMDLISGFIFYIILIIVVAFSILNTFLMTIFERTKEFGVLMAMGTTPGRLSKILILESGYITLLGIFVGIILGCLITYYFQITGIDISGASEMLAQFGIPSRIHPKLSFLSATLGPLAVFVVTLISALYPAFKVRGLKPVEAMSHI